MRLILASASRDRKRCFELAHIPVEIIPSHFDEDSIALNDPKKFVEAMALAKAETVVKFWKTKRAAKDGPAIIIAADTMVTYQGKLIGKATDKNHAFEILHSFAGHTHDILTGVAIIQSDNGQTKVFNDLSKVHFQQLTDSEIWDYINVTDEFNERAGAYSLQERASLFIDYVEGSPTNVIGIPMARLRAELKGYGVNLLNCH
jgi:septum formation protein